MSNTNAPNGFQEYGTIDGSVPNFGSARGWCLYNASAMYAGDPLIQTAGYLSKGATTGGTGAAIVGVAFSFSWVSIAQKRRVWQNYYPGSDSQGNADVEVFFTNNPQSLFVVQSSGDAITQANCGSFANFATGSGNTYTGLSGYSLDQATLNTTKGSLPFFIYKLLPAPALGSDAASSYNRVVVGIANLVNIG